MSNKTVFVLGAGASSQFGFPTGLELLKKTIYDASLDEVVGLSRSGIFQEIKDFRDALYFSGLSSVDAFLQFNDKFQEIGKLLIGCHIAKHENDKKLLMISEMDNDAHSEFDRKSWYRELWRHLSLDLDLIIKGRISFVTFNYDRSLESFFELCFQHTFYDGKHMDKTKRTDLYAKLSQINIIHTYGKLGFLPWQKQQKTDLVRLYKPLAEDELSGFWDICQTLDLVRSGGKKPVGIDKARDELSNATRIYFLGFGFDEINMDLIGVANGVFSDSQFIGGTTLGLGKAEVSRIERYFHGPKEFAPLSIDEYLREKVDWSVVFSSN